MYIKFSRNSNSLNVTIVDNSLPLPNLRGRRSRMSECLLHLVSRYWVRSFTIRVRPIISQNITYSPSRSRQVVRLTLSGTLVEITVITSFLIFPFSCPLKSISIQILCRLAKTISTSLFGFTVLQSPWHDP